MKSCISDREFEIVESVIFHGSKKEAADALNRSLYTVETTIKNVYDHLGLNKISDLTLWFCGVKFGIANEVSAFKSSVMAIVITALFSIDGMHNTQMRTRRIAAKETSRSELATTLTRRRRKEISIFQIPKKVINHAA